MYILHSRSSDNYSLLINRISSAILTYYIFYFQIQYNLTANKKIFNKKYYLSEISGDVLKSAFFNVLLK